ncbi:MULTISPECIES: Ig-like domain-containing protein [Pseudoalteromonas]|uniref:Uncharacterized protein n=1 Tax=Pseudoalteromonas luteoviolacea (strain 2ta16) TaxID=1353533 RepID=V4HRX8_PSEL2|nr:MULTISPECIES: Ig-like domain-containing protein [Pseudoalteromonas]ESP90679.1 hypothetical protein PL2TA16_01783 [Pseudoalteromonas luteoviolacea 2ta16]KZN41745.1 hypothetical protein N483_13830 [Pseudoalteromonas luteoviolacea NCIMB 1944]MCG7548096.1 Ig-like domain-containing protein [Pseudoalteromonas sp. Of7M-16]
MIKNTRKALFALAGSTLLTSVSQAAPVLNKTIHEFNAGLYIQEEFNILKDDNVVDPNYASQELRVQLSPDKSYSQIGFYDKIRTQYGQAIAYNTVDRRWVKFKGKVLYFAAVSDGTNKFETIPFRVLNPAGEASEWGEIRISLDNAFDGHYDVYPSDDFSQTSVGQPVAIDVKANDSGIPHYFGVEVYASAANGRVTVNNDKTITYTPNTGFVGQDSFKYRIKGNNLYDISSAPATVTVDVN